MVVDGTNDEPTGFKLLIPNQGMLVMRRAEGTQTASKPVFIGGESSFQDLHIDVVKTFVAAITNVLRKLQSKPNAEVQTNDQFCDDSIHRLTLTSVLLVWSVVRVSS